MRDRVRPRNLLTMMCLINREIIIEAFAKQCTEINNRIIHQPCTILKHHWQKGGTQTCFIGIALKNFAWRG